MVDVLAFIVLIILIALVGGVAYKFRHKIKKWVKDPDYGTTWRPDRRTVLNRKIEDANAELKYIDEQEQKGKESNTG